MVRVECLRPGPEPELDGVLAVEVPVFQRQVVLFRLAPQEVFGQRRPVIGRVLVVGHEHDFPVGAFLPVGPDRLEGGRPSANDDQPLGGHRRTAAVGRFVTKVTRS